MCGVRTEHTATESEPESWDSEFDFQASNAKLDKGELEKEMGVRMS